MSKIDTLNAIVKEYSKYFIYFDRAKVFDVGLRFVIRFYNDSNSKNYPNFDRKIPKYDIDKIIARYRSKLAYEVEKYKKETLVKNYKTFMYRLKMFD